MFSINLHKNIFLFPLKNAGCLLCILSKRLPSFFFFFSFLFNPVPCYLSSSGISCFLTSECLQCQLMNCGIVRRTENSLIEGRYFSAGSRQMMNLPHWTLVPWGTMTTFSFTPPSSNIDLLEGILT